MDKKFYYTDGQDKYGPFTIEELKRYNLTTDTLVWAEGMNDWTPAGQVPVLRSLFPFDPPSVPQDKNDPFRENNNNYGNNSGYQNPPSGPKPKNWLVESILVLLFCCWPLAIPAIIAASKVDSTYATGNYQGALDASDNARKWVIASFVVGLVANILVFAFVIATGDFR